MLKINNIIKINKRFNGKISFVIDNRLGERETVKAHWKTKKSSKQLIIQKADEKDLTLVATKRCEGFVGTNSIFIRMGATMNEMLPMFIDKTDKIIGQRLSLLAFDENKRLIGMLGSGAVDKQDIESHFGLPGDPIVKYKDDYYNDIINGPYKSINANRYHVLCDVAMKQSNKFFPKNVNKIGRPTALYVHPDYRGEGIGTILFAETKKLLKESGCDSWLTVAVVESSKNVVMHPDVDITLLKLNVVYKMSNFGKNLNNCNLIKNPFKLL